MIRPPMSLNVARFVVCASVALALAPTAHAASSGVALAPNDSVILVSKDVGNERWAINLDLGDANPLQLTGNVFRGADSEPAFVYCTPFQVDGSVDDIANAVFHYNCFGTSACRVGNCPEWDVIATDVTLPGSFFLPR